MIIVGVFVGVWKYFIDVKMVVSKIIFFFLFVFVKVGGVFVSKGLISLSLKNLIFVLSLSLLFVGIGVIIGLRVGIFMLFGVVGSWYIFGLIVLENGWVELGKFDGMWFGFIVKWMFWFGVIMMVIVLLVLFVFFWCFVMKVLSCLGGGSDEWDESMVS